MVVWDFFGDYHRNPKNGGVVPMIPFPLGICLDWNIPSKQADMFGPFYFARGVVKYDLICIHFSKQKAKGIILQWPEIFI